MKETLIVSNHPDSAILLLQLIRQIRRNPGLVILSIPFYKLLLESVLHLDTQIIPVLPNKHGRSKINDNVEKVLLGLANRFGNVPSIAKNPIETSVDVLSSENQGNFLICPAGKVFKEGGEDWFSGVGGILHSAYAQNPNLQIAYLYTAGFMDYKMSNPLRVENTNLLEFSSCDEQGRSLRAQITNNIKKDYNNRLGVKL